MIAAVLLVGIGVLAMLLLAPKKQAPRTRASLPPPPIAAPEPPPPPAPAPQASEGRPATVPPPAPTPPAPLGNSADADVDGITDEEEILFRTDSRKPDTDNDGFLDGNEVYHLFSPIATRPTTLRESGLVQTYTNPVYPYFIFVPSLWETRSLDPRNRAVTFTSATGEFVEVSVEDNGSGLPIRDWYRSRAPEVDQSLLQDFTTKGGYAAIWSPDKLTAFVPSGTAVYVISYNVGTRSAINFRRTFEMMINSFKITGTAPVFVEEPPSPPPAAATSTEPEPFEEPESGTATSTP